MKWTVPAKDSGIKLLAFLSQNLEGQYSAKFLKKAIERNSCQINGRTERFASTILGAGDQVILHLEKLTSSILNREEPARILFEDEVLLVYDKPAGINCDEKGILQILKTRNSSLQLVHRLDRETTGVLLLAKNPQIFSNLVGQFKQLQVHKKYLAIVDGIVAQASGIIENHLGKKHSYAGQTLWGSVNASEGMTAITQWQILAKGKNATLLACLPKTGRTHQIRVHFSEMGHPILGDFQYGKKFRCPYRAPRILLHAEELCLHHPVSGQSLTFQASLPEDFKQAKQELFR